VLRYPGVTGALQHADDDPGARCFRCGAQAAGPCASCHEPVCGDCSTLTEGGVRVWAICLGCADRKGRKLAGAWRGLLLWLAAIFVGLALVTWLLGRLVG
jgi:hypothetical protein